MTVLGVILARGGSKRLPGKNLKMLGNAPLLAWTLAEAKESKHITNLVLSSDCDDILEIGKANGVETLKRPAMLARDTSDSYCALWHAMASVPRHDYVCLLQPTSPFRTVADIDGCISWCMMGGIACATRTGDEGRVPNGAVYCARWDWLLAGNSWDDPGVMLKSMPAYRSVDIDTPADFLAAQEMTEAAIDGLFP